MLSAMREQQRFEQVGLRPMLPLCGRLQQSLEMRGHAEADGDTLFFGHRQPPQKRYGYTNSLCIEVFSTRNFESAGERRAKARTRWVAPNWCQTSGSVDEAGTRLSKTGKDHGASEARPSDLIRVVANLFRKWS